MPGWLGCSATASGSKDCADCAPHRCAMEESPTTARRFARWYPTRPIQAGPCPKGASDASNPGVVGRQRLPWRPHASSGVRASGARGDVTRLDCGTAPADRRRRALFRHLPTSGLKIQLVFSCYLIKHGDDYMLWDTGHPHERRRRGAEGEPGGPARAAERQARADQVRRHQPLSRRPHRPGRLVSAGDAADRQGRLGRARRARSRRPARTRRRSRTGSAAAARSSRCRWTRTCSATAPS